VRKKRILFSTYYGNGDIANFNCAHGPFSQLLDHVEIVTPLALQLSGEQMLKSCWWSEFRHWLGIDAAFVHRPYGWYGQQVIAAAKTHGVPIWVHHDDDLLAIPETSPYYEAYVLQDQAYPSVEMSYEEADIISCQSTLMHKMLVHKYAREDAHHIPIALDDRLLHLKRPWTNNNKVCWRGSDSHKQDLLSHKKELQAIFDNNEEMEFNFFILNPRELGFKVKNLVMHEGLPMFSFYRRITEINAAYAIVLLEDNHFNRVKSHLAWLDHTLAGSLVFGPVEFPEFQRPGIDDLKVLDGAPITFLHKNHDASWTEIQQKYTNSVTNLKRLEIIKSL
jgi:hypothetical protein